MSIPVYLVGKAGLNGGLAPAVGLGIMQLLMFSIELVDALDFVSHYTYTHISAISDGKGF